MKKAFIIVCISLLLYGCSKDIIIKDAITGSNVYPMFGGVPERNFYIPIEVSDSLKLIWQEEVNGSFGPTSVTAFSDYIFVPDLSGRIYSFNVKSGKGAGQVKHKGVINPAPIIELNKLIFPVAEQKENKTTLRIYDFRNGKELQDYEINGIVLSEIIKLKDGFLFLTENGKAMRFNYTSGKVWEYASGSFVHSSPASTDNFLIFGNDKGEVIILNAADGKLQMKKNVGAGFQGGFTISGDRYYAGDKSGVVYCGDLKSGNLIWSFKSGSRISSTPVLENNFMYICNLGGDLFKLNKEDGSVVWHTPTGGILNVTPLAFKNYLLLPDLNQKLYFIDTKTGKISNTLEFESRTKLVPVFYDNTLILGADDGKIFAYEFVN